MEEKLNPCPFCSGECDPEGWQVGDTTGPMCTRCGAHARTVAEWQEGEITEGNQDY
jgi:hypothetical protein